MLNIGAKINEIEKNKANASWRKSKKPKVDF